MDQEQETTTRGSSEGNQSEWVHDSSLDYKGNLPLRDSTGVWRASLFIIAIELSERVSYFGISTNMISYLTNVMHEEVKMAAKSVNYWAGVTTTLPLVGGFVADAYTGPFNMILLSSLVYLTGLSIMTMSQLTPTLQPCNTGMKCHHKPRKIHEILFFLSIYCLSLGTGGIKPCLESFGADQFDDDHPDERIKKLSYFNLWNFALCCGLVIAVTLIVYVQDNMGWGVADLILSFAMGVSVVAFYTGRPYYRYRLSDGSPLTPMLRVLVGAVRKRHLAYPSGPHLLYEVPKSVKSQGRLLGHTNRLRFLDKAAILENESETSSTGLKHNPWRLSTVTEVEELKLFLNMIPIWLTSFPFGVCVAQSSTFFIKQGATLDRKISRNFNIPPASLYLMAALGMIVSVIIYEKILVPALRRATGNERGINILKRIGIGMIFSILAMSVAALVEMRRLRVAREEIPRMRGEKNATHLSMSVFWLAPQFLILGLGDGFTLVGLQEYFYEQVPDRMRSLGMAFYLSVLGIGSFISSFMIGLVDRVTDKGGESWFGQDLNSSRLDKFYWLLAAMNVVNLCVYVVLARRYTYKVVQRKVDLVDDCCKDDGIKLMA